MAGGRLVAEGTPDQLRGDDPAAKATVSALIESLGFRPVDAGSLRTARTLEDLAFLRGASTRTRLRSTGSTCRVSSPAGPACARPGSSSPTRLGRDRPAHRASAHMFEASGGAVEVPSGLPLPPGTSGQDMPIVYAVIDSEP